MLCNLKVNENCSSLEHSGEYLLDRTDYFLTTIGGGGYTPTSLLFDVGVVTFSSGN
jgi:hypothetical protein